MGESVSFESLTVVVIGGTPSGIRISPDTSITPPSLSNPGAPRGRGFFPPDNLHCLLFRPRKNMICGDLHDAPFEHAAMAGWRCTRLSLWFRIVALACPAA